jgi:hypothetical protein
MKLNAQMKQSEVATQGTPSPSEESTMSATTTLSPDPKGRLKTVLSKNLQE